MDVIGVIPARFASSRFEGKVLADILGKPMIQRVWENAKKARMLDALIVACDDDRIYKAVTGFGGRAVMTAREHTSGTERILEVVADMDVRVVVNIQGDEPLLHPSMIDDAARALLDDPALVVATLAKRIEDAAEVIDPHVVKVVCDKKSHALYFSRATIPHVRDAEETQNAAYYKHIGLYATTKDFLFIYKNLAPSRLEQLEKLEQLRILENGYSIKVLETRHETIGVDTPKDLEKVVQYLQSQRHDVAGS